MGEAVKQEKALLFFLTVLFLLAIPLVMTWISFSNFNKNILVAWPNYVTFAAAGAGTAIIIYAARRWKYGACVVFLLPGLAALAVQVAIAMSINPDPGSPLNYAAIAGPAATPFLLLAIDRVLARPIKNEWRYALAAIAVGFVCTGLLYLLGTRLYAALHFSFSSKALPSFQLTLQYMIRRFPYNFGIEYAAYALLLSILREKPKEAAAK